MYLRRVCARSASDVAHTKKRLIYSRQHMHEQEHEGQDASLSPHLAAGRDGDRPYVMY